MRICLVAPEPTEYGAVSYSVAALAALLAERHEVTLVRSGCADGAAPPPLPGSGFREVVAAIDPESAGLKFACEDHRHGAAVVDAVRASYGEQGPDLLEVPDFRAHGLVALQARLAGEPLLARTLIAVRAAPSAELACLHDGTLGQPGMERLADLEREQLRLADRLLHAGGDAHGIYERHYLDVGLPRPALIRTPLPPGEPVPAPAAAERDPEAPLRILFAADLRRREGALDLAQACLGLPGDEWELTLAGADTATAQVGQSVRLTIETMSGDDPRIQFREPLYREQLRRALPEHDLLAVPARLALGAETAVEALRAGVPVLATPAGPLVEAVEDGVTGWRTDGLGSAAIGRVLAPLVTDPAEVGCLRRGVLTERAAALADPAAILAGYERLLSPGGGRPPLPAAPPRQEPLVSGVVPYYRASAYVAEAVGSLLAQTHRNLEVLVVNDGSFEPEDAVLAEIEDDPRVRVVTQLNGGESSARNLGALLTRGEYMLPLDADNMLEPEFVERALATFRRDPSLAYVGCWLPMVDPDGVRLADGFGFAPLGNAVLHDDGENWDGDTLSLFPRRFFYEPWFGFAGSMNSDWQLFRRLRERGWFGAIMPEPLARYRVLPDSLLRGHSQRIHERARAEDRWSSRLLLTRWTTDD
ncbi:MAG TPA: glycosyltransferase [Solirubrobacterales bacterium]|nr:glycosyltransferase [Solirubrobacterales bacterium]